jgi:hypothetical protein
MVRNAVIVCTVENLSMTGAKAVEILMMKLFPGRMGRDRAPSRPVDAAFAIRFA